MKAKIILLGSAILGMSACSSQPEYQPQAPLDMQSVQAYQNKVYSGNTVPVSKKVKEQPEVEMPMNVSDKQAADERFNTRRSYHPGNVVLVPSIGYGYHHHSHW
ncbi:hypothetical protein [Mannheimia massilioguelmaensis]|uniref:hypothetical protein n=1 Tax=Mannheimia massilioguelmaensis TaxID=1604354 RepID=UPI0005C84F72|nr:hypothetical protein [Mannheimia massilioguelmaensis]